ncbi:hypothetical protein J6590_034236 [Homalodisca vitripennis]|nr:hypothetical protein J6590_034236 [Homalodisca vitripennis]
MGLVTRFSDRSLEQWVWPQDSRVGRWVQSVNSLVVQSRDRESVTEVTTAERRSKSSTDLRSVLQKRVNRASSATTLRKHRRRLFLS